MKNKYLKPETRMVIINENLCEAGLNNASVRDYTGQTTIDRFDVNENKNPGGNNDNSWYDDTDNWGGS